MNLSKSTIVCVVLIFISTMLDVVSTHAGVMMLGNKEVSPIARYVMEVLGVEWWVAYYPYEASVLLAAFFLVRFLRFKLASVVSGSLVKYPIEYLVILVSYTTIVNNMIQLMIRLGIVL